MIRDLWYKNTVIYNVDLETFLDANSDGVGDFEGLMRQLPYLDALGVEVIWLAPFQPTPNRDNGYDVCDYYGVDPRHGSSGDFVEFMNAAHKYGIKVIIDLVVNHTSDQHRWFQAARSDEDSPYRDWYIWSEEKPEESPVKSVFPGKVESAWTYDEEVDAYYFHRFYPFQPDLNIDNPDVRTEIHRIIGYWLQLGVYGFRMDAVPYLIESDVKQAQPKQDFEYLYEFRDFAQWRRGNAILLGEVNLPPEETMRYFGDGDELLHMVFNFYVNQYLWYALATGEVQRLIDALNATRGIPKEAQWAQFLRNHDELNLDRLSAEERQRVFDAFGPEEEMQIYGRGIRRRLAPMLQDRSRIELAYSMLFSLPGTPVIYYGDEIGLGDNLELDGRTAVRTPMQWTHEKRGGFSLAEDLVRPVIEEGPYSYHYVNVEDQRRHPESLLNWMAHMIRLRKESPEIGWGEWIIVDTGNPSVLALCYQWRGTALITVHNFSDEAQEVQIKPDLYGGDYLVNLLVHAHSHADDDGVHHLSLDGYGYRWYRVGHFTRALQRERE